MYEAERQLAVRAVLDACRLCRTVQANLVTADSLAKKDRSPVTVADFGAQAVVAAQLMEAFPDDPLIGEESADALRADDGAELRAKVVQNVQAVSPRLDESQILTAIDYGNYPGGGEGRHWTLDPIDGTKGFLRGEQYAVAFALIVDGRVRLGVLGCPNYPLSPGKPDGEIGCLFVAVEGQGAFVRSLDNPTETPINVTSITDTSQASFCESVESGHSAHDKAARVADILGVSVPPYRIDSQCKYAAVARGDASIYLRLPVKAGYEECVWDHAAGAIVVTEAGGSVTDVTGAPLDFSQGRRLSKNPGVVATNGHIHDRVIDAVRQVVPVG